MNDRDNEFMDTPLIRAISLVVMAAMIWVTVGAIMAAMFG